MSLKSKLHSKVLTMCFKTDLLYKLYSNLHNFSFTVTRIMKRVCWNPVTKCSKIKHYECCQGYNVPLIKAFSK
jgi:hypothetical protein